MVLSRQELLRVLNQRNESQSAKSIENVKNALNSMEKDLLLHTLYFKPYNQHDAVDDPSLHIEPGNYYFPYYFYTLFLIISPVIFTLYFPYYFYTLFLIISPIIFTLLFLIIPLLFSHFIS